MPLPKIVTYYGFFNNFIVDVKATSRLYIWFCIWTVLNGIPGNK